MKHVVTLLLFGLLTPLGSAWAQSVGVGTATPDPKAALDIRATDKGLLIPRLTQTQRQAIAAPPQGLMVYQTDAPEGFYYFGGAPGAWVYLNPGGGGFTLPYSGSYAGPAGTTAFDVSHTNGGFAIRGAAPNTGVGVYGEGTTGSGVYGTASGTGGYGVRGRATASNSTGVQGQATGANGYGVVGLGEYGVYGSGGAGPGLYGFSTNGPALLAEKTSGLPGRIAQFTSSGTGNDSTGVHVATNGARPALRAVSTNASPQAAIRGVKQAGTDGIGVEGVVRSGGGNAAGVRGLDQSNTGTGSGVIGLTQGGYGVRGIASASGGYGVSGSSTDSYGVVGGSQSGAGVYGSTQANANTVAGVVGVGNAGSSAVGVLGQTTNGYGVRGVASAAGGYGVQGLAQDSYGVIGTSTSGEGVYGGSTSDYGVRGQSASSAGVYGLTGAGNVGNVAGVLGTSTNAGGVGVLGTTTAGYGVRGIASATNGIGVQGNATNLSGVAGYSNSGFGTYGSSASNSGVYGTTAASGSGVAGVEGNSTASTGVGVLGTTAGGSGVRGTASAAGGYGVEGQASANGGYGLAAFGNGPASGLAAAALGTGQAARFVQTNAANTSVAVEVQNSSLGATALFDQTNAANAAPALQLRSAATQGVRLLLTGGAGSGSQTNAGRIDFDVNANPVAQVVGYVSPALADPTLDLNVRRGFGGVLERCLSLSNSTGSRLYGGLYVYPSPNSAGDLYVQGSFSASGTKAFKIDHPLDPENRYLYHSCVESPDVKNIYDGTVQLDAQGAATVQLPAYFEALNQDFRYQLTAVGAPGPNLYVAQPVRGNAFRIAGGAPGAEVSWQVTGIRHDRAAQAHPLVPEVAKEPENRGQYLTPTAYGLPASRGIGFRPAPAVAGGTPSGR